jgi:hypothetical protein
MIMICDQGNGGSISALLRFLTSLWISDSSSDLARIKIRRMRPMLPLFFLYKSSSFPSGRSHFVPGVLHLSLSFRLSPLQSFSDMAHQTYSVECKATTTFTPTKHKILYQQNDTVSKV